MKSNILNTQNALKISFFKNHINRTNDYAKSLQAKKIDISHKLIYPHTHPQTSAVLSDLYFSTNRLYKSFDFFHYSI